MDGSQFLDYHTQTVKRKREFRHQPCSIGKKVSGHFLN